MYVHVVSIVHLLSVLIWNLCSLSRLVFSPIFFDVQWLYVLLDPTFWKHNKWNIVVMACLYLQSKMLRMPLFTIENFGDYFIGTKYYFLIKSCHCLYIKLIWKIFRKKYVMIISLKKNHQFKNISSDFYLHTWVYLIIILTIILPGNLYFLEQIWLAQK